MSYDEEKDSQVLTIPENDECSESPASEQELIDEDLEAVSAGVLPVGPNPPRGPLSSGTPAPNPAKAP